MMLFAATISRRSMENRYFYLTTICQDSDSSLFPTERVAFLGDSEERVFGGGQMRSARVSIPAKCFVDFFDVRDMNHRQIAQELRC